MDLPPALIEEASPQCSLYSISRRGVDFGVSLLYVEVCLHTIYLNFTFFFLKNITEEWSFPFFFGVMLSANVQILMIWNL